MVISTWREGVRKGEGHRGLLDLNLLSFFNLGWSHGVCFLIIQCIAYVNCVCFAVRNISKNVLSCIFFLISIDLQISKHPPK